MSGKTLSFITLILAAMLSQAVGELYAPSLPSMTTYFDTTINMVQWTLVIYMVGASLTQLVYGPLSEVYGRRLMLIAGITIFVIGSLISVHANSIEMLILGRFIQGMGAGSPAGLWRTVFRDLFQGPALAKYASYFTIVVSMVFPLAPALGGMFETYFNWRASFWFMLIYSSFLLVLFCTVFQETHKNLNAKLTLKDLLHGYWELLKTPLFLGATSFTFLMFGALFSTIATAPVLFIKLANISPMTFGWITCITTMGCMSFSAWLNGRLVEPWGLDKMIAIGFGCTCTSGILFAGGYWLMGQAHPVTMIIAMMFLYFGAGIIFPNAFSKAFIPLKKNIGFAGSLYGFIQMSGGAVMGALTSLLPDTSPLPLSGILIGCAVGGWTVLRTLRRF